MQLNLNINMPINEKINTCINCFPPNSLDPTYPTSSNKLIPKSSFSNSISRTPKYITVNLPQYILDQNIPSYHPNSIYKFGSGTNEDPYWLDSIIIDKDNRPLYIKGLDALGTIGNALMLNEDNVRVENMLKSNQLQFFNVSPRRISAGLGAIGNILSFTKVGAIPGTILQIPQTAFNVYDVATDPSIPNNFELGLLVASEVTRPLLNAASVKFPIPKFNKVTRITPSGTRASTFMYNPIMVDVTTPAKLGTFGLQATDFVGNLNQTFTGKQTYETLFGLPHLLGFHDVINIYKDENGDVFLRDLYLYKNDKVNK